MSQATALAKDKILRQLHWIAKLIQFKGVCNLPTFAFKKKVELYFVSFLTPPRWLHGLIDTYGGVQPDTDEVHVPAGRKSDVKVWYDEEVKGGNSDLLPVSTRQFNRVWLENLPHLKCRAFLRSVLLVHEF